ncbi:MAG: IS200/IS605 family transposase [Bacteroidota bacterium]
MPYIKVYIHFVWSTKRRQKFLNSFELRKKVWKHIKENSIKKDIHIEMINGYSDHCHCLVSLDNEKSIGEVMRLLKGESSFWINKNRLCNERFKWQNDYYAVSVCDSAIKNVRDYIKNQETHHKKFTFYDEFEEFIEKHGFERFLD